MQRVRNLCLIILVFSLSACGYRLGRGEALCSYSTVCIPFVDGDEEGIFTATLIRAMTTRGSLAYVNEGADLALKVCLFAPDDSNIGFIYAPESKEGGVSKIITANEARLILRARVTLVDRQSGECLLGPMEIRSSLAYDFESDLSNVNQNAFSLGQFEMHTLAVDTAFPPLYTLLAEKIVDYVNNTW